AAGGGEAESREERRDSARGARAARREEDRHRRRAGEEVVATVPRQIEDDRFATVHPEAQARRAEVEGPRRRGGAPPPRLALDVAPENHVALGEVLAVAERPVEVFEHRVEVGVAGLA